MRKRILLAVALCVPQLSLYAQPTNRVFEQEFLGDSARVTTQQNLPTSAWNISCRDALTIPLKQQLKDTLSARLKVELPEHVSFIDAHIDNYKSWNQDQWLHCKADVSINDEEKNLAALAIRVAWALDPQQQRESLNPLVKHAMQHPFSSADAVALIAKLAKPEQQVSYLDNNLDIDGLTLDQAKYAVLSIWSTQQRWQDMIDLAHRCNSLECQQILRQAEDAKEQEDAEKADDLDSYF